MRGVGDPLHLQVRHELLQTIQIAGQDLGIPLSPDDQRGRVD